MALKTLSTLLILLTLTLSSLAQNRYSNQQFEFSIEKPKHWVELAGSEILIGRENLNLKDGSLTDLLKEHQGPLLLTAFSKYDPSTYDAGLIPKIQISAIARHSRSFDEFTEEVAAGMNSFKNYFQDFIITSPIRTVSISGIQCVHFSITFSLLTENGDKWKVRSSAYAIPYGKFFIQVSLTDGQEMVGNTELFDRLISSIVVGK